MTNETMTNETTTDRTATDRTRAPSSTAAILNAGRFMVRGGLLVPASAPAPGPGESPDAALARRFVGPLGGGALTKTKTKTMTKTKTKAGLDRNALGGFAGLFPAEAMRRLHLAPPAQVHAARDLPWERLDIPPPPGPDATRAETQVLLAKQDDVVERERRRPDILLEASLDVSAFTRPLGIDGLDGYDATQALFQTILSLCAYAGYLYKDRFGRPRPNQVEPRLRPMLPNPPHLAYPSNHAFQSFSLAYAFTTLLPEHPATAELFVAAQRVAENREWAGLHYPSDTMAGKALARRFLPHLCEACAEEIAAARDEWI